MDFSRPSIDQDFRRSDPGEDLDLDFGPHHQKDESVMDFSRGIETSSLSDHIDPSTSDHQISPDDLDVNTADTKPQQVETIEEVLPEVEAHSSKIIQDDPTNNIVVVKEVIEEIDEQEDKNLALETEMDTSDIKTENGHLFEEASYAIVSATQALEHAQEAVTKIKNLVNDFISIEGIADPLLVAMQCCRDAANAVDGAATVWQEIHRQDIAASDLLQNDVKVKSEEVFEDNKEDFYNEDYGDDDDFKEAIKKSMKEDRATSEKKKFSCSSCDFVANRKNILARHMLHEHEVKNDPKKYQCEKCSFTCDTERTYRKHAQAKHKAKIHRCCQCEEMFFDKEAQENHAKTAHADEEGKEHSCKLCDGSARAPPGMYFKYIREVESMFECELCDYKHKDMHATRKHVKKHHLSNTVYKCDRCAYVARDSCHLKEHISAKHEGITFPCPWEGCIHVSSQKRNLKKHIDVIHRRIEHYCKDCGFKTRHPELLKKHMKMKHLVEKYFCDECTYAAPTLVSLNTHKGKAHPPGEAGKIKSDSMSGIIPTTDINGVRMYKCDHCDYATSHLNNLKHVHMKKHTGELLQCDHCPYSTWSKSALNTHIKARHEEHKYRCDQCDFTSSLGFQFRRHYESKHEGTVYKCDKCEFSAIRPEYLKKHMRKHEGKAFKCEFEGCSFIGPYMSDLKVHIDAVHKGIRHKCTDCEFTSGRKGDLNKHMKKVHGSEGHKFKCLRCPFATSNETDLLNHVKVVHDPEIAVLIMDELKLGLAMN